ncbi:MAG: hypothetical protein GY778_30335 [bacterium]|nr:hypothetical protein [bacterium]
MAAPRAQQRIGGVSAIHVWLIVFVGLWLASTVLLVWLYTDQTGLTDTADDLRVSNTELQQKHGASENDLKALAELAVGAEDDLDTVTEKVGDVYARIRDDEIVPDVSAFDDPTGGLLAAMTSLYDGYRGEYDARTACGDEFDRLQVEVEDLAAARSQREQEYEAKSAELVSRINTLESDLADYRGRRDDEMDGMEGRIDALREEYSRDLQDLRQENTDLQQKLAEQQTRYGELQARFGAMQISPEALLTARQGDGRILTAKPGDDVVYISLGRKHQLTRGMVFAVYDSEEGIPADGVAKARIEVARIFDETAECTISEVLGREMILEGDIVNNPIYDRSRALTFVVAGLFGSTGGGRQGSESTAQIETLIREWGGQVVDTVSARVDFVVLGDSPRRPSAVGELSPEATARQAGVREVYERYSQISSTAAALSVPVLTEQTLLHFLGYSGQS